MYRMEISDELIQKLLADHKKRKEYERDRYHNKLKLDPEFVEKNRQRAREHYAKNKKKKHAYYESKQALNNARSNYRYYVRAGRESEFQARQPEKYDLLVKEGFIHPLETEQS